MKQVIFIFFLTISVFVNAQEAQWRGPERDGRYPDTNLLKSWPAAGPDVLFQVEGIGRGHSSAVVSSGIVYVTGLKDSMDMISAFDLKGTRIWNTVYGSAWDQSYPDTRNTPVVSGNRVFITSGIGEIVCLNALTGEQIWRKNPHKEYKGVYSYWGMAESILLVDNEVICIVGGKDASVVALSKENGDLIWKSPSVNDARAYASASLIERNGTRVILVELERYLLGINPDDGGIFWQYDLAPDSIELLDWLNHTNTPLYENGEIFITRGYDMDALMISLSEDARSVKLKWKNKVLDTHFGGVVAHNGFIFGSNWETNSKGKWVCLNWESGELMYEEEWFNKGPIIYADEHLYCIDEKRGNLALVQPDTTGFKVISTFRVEPGAGPYWAHPTIYNGNLFVRHGDALIVYDLKNR